MANNLDKQQRAAENQQAKEEREREKAAEKRRIREERQERKVERLTEPMSAWLCRTFRVVTVVATILMCILEVRNGRMIGADNIMERVTFTALCSWSAFGLVWVASAVARMISLSKAGQDDSPKYASYRKNVLAALTGFAIILVLSLAF